MASQPDGAKKPAVLHVAPTPSTGQIAVPIEMWQETGQGQPECIGWRSSPQRSITREGSLLGDFMRLVDESAEEICWFAKTWGPLSIGRHGLPASRQADLLTAEDRTWEEPDESAAWLRKHDEELPPSGMLPVKNRQDLGRPLSEEENRYLDAAFDSVPPTWEPVPAWRHYARHFRALLRCAERIKRQDADPRVQLDWPDWHDALLVRRSSPSPKNLLGRMQWDQHLGPLQEAKPDWSGDNDPFLSSSLPRYLLDPTIEGRGEVLASLFEWHIDRAGLTPVIERTAEGWGVALGFRRHEAAPPEALTLYEALVHDLIATLNGNLARCQKCSEVINRDELPRPYGNIRDICQPCRTKKIYAQNKASYHRAKHRA